MNQTAKILWAIALAAIAGYAVLYVRQDAADNGPPKIATLGEEGVPAAASTTKPADKLEKFILHDTPRPLEDMVFTGPDGQPLTLESFEGKVVLLNIWATWCAPCRHEMPSLDRLQQQLGSDQFEVVALSVDRTGLEGVKRFFKETGATDLKAYVDPTTKLLKPLKVEGMPTTLLLDRKGREIGRLTGPAEWDTAAAKEIVAKAINATQVN